MNDTQATVFCTTCRKDMTFHNNVINHRQELIRSLFTCGIWLPVWLAMAFTKVKVCDGCDNIIIEG